MHPVQLDELVNPSSCYKKASDLVSQKYCRQDDLSHQILFMLFTVCPGFRDFHALRIKAAIDIYNVCLDRVPGGTNYLDVCIVPKD